MAHGSTPLLVDNPSLAMNGFRAAGIISALEL